SLRAPKSKRVSAESVVSIRWNPPARDHSSRPLSVRRLPTPSFQDAVENRKNAAKGSAHMVAGKPQRKKPNSMRMKATALAVRTHSSFLRLTINPLSDAHFPH